MTSLYNAFLIVALVYPRLATSQYVTDIAATMPITYGAQTDFGDLAMQQLLKSISGQIHLASNPKFQRTTTAEPTCSDRVGYCSTTYFGDELTLVSLESASYEAVWHSDVSPSTCRSNDGCEIKTDKAVALLTQQTNGWSIGITLDSKLTFKQPDSTGGTTTSISIGYSNTVSTSHTVTNTKTYSSTCDDGNICYLETGTVYVTVKGICTSDPLMVCNSDIRPCNDMSTYSNACSQYSSFTNQHCTSDGKSKNANTECTARMAVVQDDGTPLALQVFEQLPLSSLQKKRDTSSDPFGTLPDGSTGDYFLFSTNN